MSEKLFTPALNESTELGSHQDGHDTKPDARNDVARSDSYSSCLHEVEGLLPKRGERRVAAAEAHHEADAEPLRGAVAVYKRRNQEAHCEAARDVDRKSGPRKRGLNVALDPRIHAIARKSAKPPTERNCEGDSHTTRPFVVGAISRPRRLKASPIACHRFYRGLHEPVPTRLPVRSFATFADLDQGLRENL